MIQGVIPVGQPIRIALAGCGRIAKNHFDAIAKVDGLDLVALARFAVS